MDIPLDAEVRCTDGAGGKTVQVVLNPVRREVTHVVVRQEGLLGGRGDEVEAVDGRVGRVDELPVDPKNYTISHIVLREGHLWGARDVTVPVAQIAEIEEGIVRLKLSRSEVGALPAESVRRTSD